MTSMQSSSRIIMVRPASFGFNTQSADTIPFQNEKYANSLPADHIHHKALIEFDRMVEQLRAHGVHVDAFDDTPTPIKPDAIFPNNWISTHSDGTIILYPMYAHNRRPEHREDIIKKLSETYHVTVVIDLTPYERRDECLEGTGSLVLDRVNKVTYAIRSPHTHDKIVEHFTKLMNYQQPPVIFDSVDENEVPIYHTNVIMAIGTHVVIICLESVHDKSQREMVVKSLEKNGNRKIIDITMEQLNHFAGNALEVQNSKGELLLVMSKTAYDSLTDEQRNTIEQTNTKLVYFDINNIEQCGGGSVRCMIAENFLPLNK